jgi:acetoin utilization protein AcuB
MEHRCPQCGVELPQGVPAWARQLTVAHAMSSDPVTISPEDTLMRAVELMRMHGIRRMPVVMGGNLVGLLAEGDLKRAQPSTLSESEAEFNQVMEGTQVARIMIQNPVTVGADTPLLEAAQTLHTTKYGALPVLEGGRLRGMLTDTDLIRCLTDILAHGG